MNPLLLERNYRNQGFAGFALRKLCRMFYRRVHNERWGYRSFPLDGLSDIANRRRSDIGDRVFQGFRGGLLQGRMGIDETGGDDLPLDRHSSRIAGTDIRRVREQCCAGASSWGLVCHGRSHHAMWGFCLLACSRWYVAIELGTMGYRSCDALFCLAVFEWSCHRYHRLQGCGGTADALTQFGYYYGANDSDIPANKRHGRVFLLDSVYEARPFRTGRTASQYPCIQLYYSTRGVSNARTTV